MKPSLTTHTSKQLSLNQHCPQTKHHQANPTDRHLSIGSGQKTRIEKKDIHKGERERSSAQRTTLSFPDSKPSKSRVELDVSQIRFNALEKKKNHTDNKPNDTPTRCSNNPWELLEEACEVDEQELERYTAKWERLAGENGNKELTLGEILKELEVEGFEKQIESSEKQDSHPVETEKTGEARKSRTASSGRIRESQRNQKQGSQTPCEKSGSFGKGAQFAHQSARIAKAFVAFTDRISNLLSMAQMLPLDRNTVELQIALRETLILLKNKQMEHQRLTIEIGGSDPTAELIDGMRKNDELINWFYSMRTWLTDYLEYAARTASAEHMKLEISNLIGNKKEIARLPSKNALQPANLKKAVSQLLELKSTLFKRLLTRIKEETEIKQLVGMFQPSPMQSYLENQSKGQLEYLNMLVRLLAPFKFEHLPRSKNQLESRIFYLKLAKSTNLASNYLDSTHVDFTTRLVKFRLLDLSVKMPLESSLEIMQTVMDEYASYHAESDPQKLD